jgi:hypothetical protein
MFLWARVIGTTFTGTWCHDSEDNDDRLPLQDAVYNGNEAVIRMLLPRGNLNTKIKDGAYPIHWTSDKATSAQ